MTSTECLHYKSPGQRCSNIGHFSTLVLHRTRTSPLSGICMGSSQRGKIKSYSTLSRSRAFVYAVLQIVVFWIRESMPKPQANSGRSFVVQGWKRPHPFNVIEVTQDFFNYSGLLSPLYKAKCPIPTSPIREFRIEVEHPKIVSSRWLAWSVPASTACFTAQVKDEGRSSLQSLYCGPSALTMRRHSTMPATSVIWSIYHKHSLYMCFR